MKTLLLALVCLASPVWASDEVSLLTSMNVPMSKYGMNWQSAGVRVRVKNLAYDKSVRVVFTDADGQTTVANASYTGPADNGYEVWQAFNNLHGYGEGSFHVEYSVQGQTFQSNDQALKIGPVFYAGQNIQQVLSGTQFSGNYASFVAAVRNLAYTKNVEAHYSCDDFQSASVAPLGFQSYFWYGYGSVTSPTAEGFEMWSTGSLPIPTSCSTLRYYYTYEVAGQRYADTNFGHNYVMYRY